jgi:hypothetical protein
MCYVWVFGVSMFVMYTYIFRFWFLKILHCEVVIFGQSPVALDWPGYSSLTCTPACTHACMYVCMHKCTHIPRTIFLATALSHTRKLPHTMHAPTQLLHHKKEFNGTRRVAGLTWNRLLMKSDHKLESSYLIWTSLASSLTECKGSLEASFLALWQSRSSWNLYVVLEGYFCIMKVRSHMHMMVWSSRIIHVRKFAAERCVWICGHPFNPGRE